MRYVAAPFLLVCLSLLVIGQEPKDTEIEGRAGRRALEERILNRVRAERDAKTSYPGTVVSDLTDEEYVAFKLWRKRFNEKSKPIVVFHRAGVQGRGDDTGIIVTLKNKRLEGNDLNEFVTWFNESDSALDVRQAIDEKLLDILFFKK